MSRRKNRPGSDNYDYRAAYFRNHKGFFGWYLCGICGLPVHKNNSHIDHIMPQSKSKFLFNRDFNLQIAHPKCNQKKSDKIDHRVATGYLRKGFGGIIGTLLSIPIMLVTTLLTLIFGAGSGIANGAVSLVGKAIGGIFRLIGNVIKGTFNLLFNLIVRNIPIVIAIVVIGFIMLNK